MPLDPGDVVDIQRLYSRYNVAADRGDGKAFADCFVSNGVFDIGRGTRFEGPEALAEFAAGIPAVMPGSRHIVTNIQVDGEGDEATGTAYVTLLNTRSEPITVASSGIYDDRVVRSEHAWRFAERRFIADTPASDV